MNDSTPDLHASAQDLAAAAGQIPSSEFDELKARVQAELDGYELLECLGRGGMGAVFRARQVKLDREVAVKVLLPPPGEVKGWSERFQREAQALARLVHPGIVTVHDFGQCDEHAWIVMELVDGANLREMLEGGRLPQEEALAIVPKLCDALQYAHDQGVVHRDIKPENVLFDRQGSVKIVDFGLAKLTGGAPGMTLTRSDQAMGTLRYMAPEQLERPRQVDHRADIFSLGVVFYEMLTGHVPAGAAAPPSSVSGVSESVDDVVMASLDRDPDKRQQSASQVEQELQGVEAAPPAQAEPPAREREPVGAWTPPTFWKSFALSELLALLAVPCSIIYVMVHQGLFRFEQSSSGSMADLEDIGSPHSIMICGMLAAWIPAFFAVYWWIQRRAASRGELPPAPFLSMPVLRLKTIAALVGVILFLGRIAAQGSGLPPVVYVYGLLMIFAAAHSERGAYRSLWSETKHRALLWVSWGFCATATVIVLFSWMMTSKNSTPVESLVTIVPLFVLGAGSVALFRGGRLVNAASALSASAGLTLALRTSLPKFGSAYVEGVPVAAVRFAIFISLVLAFMLSASAVALSAPRRDDR